MWTLAPGRIEIPAASPCPSEAKLDPRICPIWPPRDHLFHVHPAASLVDVRPRGAPNGGSNMARKTYNSVEHDQSAGTELDAEIREFVRRDVVTNREQAALKSTKVIAESLTQFKKAPDAPALSDLED